jgi:hypothetical protein
MRQKLIRIIGPLVAALFLTRAAGALLTDFTARRPTPRRLADPPEAAPAPC